MMVVGIIGIVCAVIAFAVWCCCKVAGDADRDTEARHDD